MKRVVIEGASGYSGMELTKLLAGHPSVVLAGVSSSRWAGRSVREELGLAGSVGQLTYQKTLADVADVAVALLATPPEASRDLASTWLGRGARVVDLSNAFRGDPQAVYGLTEHAREALAGARLVANPGCYPTAVLTALLPLQQKGFLAPGPVFVDAKSGVTGAGRKVSEHLLFNEMGENHYPYRVGSHQHVPEMERVLGRPLLFTPHLLPVRRGLLATCYVPVAQGVESEALAYCLTEAYAGEPFVQVVAPDAALGIRQVVNTPLCRVAVAPAVKGGYARIFGVVDNLMKGAASQAVQNLNRVLGLEETLGLCS